MPRLYTTVATLSTSPRVGAVACVLVSPQIFFHTLSADNTLINVYTLTFQLVYDRALLIHEGAWLLFLASRMDLA